MDKIKKTPHWYAANPTRASSTFGRRGACHRSPHASSANARSLWGPHRCHPCLPGGTKKWRRERDSNPRSTCALTRFPIVPIQPALASLRPITGWHPFHTPLEDDGMCGGYYFLMLLFSLRLPRKNFFINSAQRSASIPPITAILCSSAGSLGIDKTLSHAPARGSACSGTRKPAPRR